MRASRVCAVPRRGMRVRAAALPASFALQPAAVRRRMQSAMVHMASSTPQQFSTFLGNRMLLPECFVKRAKTFALKKPAQMSFLGVGAPEAILVGVVALVVFGPKGLADAAKSIGAAVRSLQPSIKEVVQVSQELKGTLDQELGLDELRDAARPTTARPMSEQTAKEMDPDIDAKRAEAAKAAWGGEPSPTAGASSTAAAASTTTPTSTPASSAVADKPAPSAPAPPTGPATGTAPVAAAPTAAAAAAGAPKPASPTPAAPASAPKDMSSLSMEELEAELARRKAAGDK